MYRSAANRHAIIKQLLSNSSSRNEPKPLRGCACTKHRQGITIYPCSVYSITHHTVSEQKKYKEYQQLIETNRVNCPGETSRRIMCRISNNLFWDYLRDSNTLIYMYTVAHCQSETGDVFRCHNTTRKGTGHQATINPSYSSTWSSWTLTHTKGNSSFVDIKRKHVYTTCPRAQGTPRKSWDPLEHLSQRPRVRYSDKPHTRRISQSSKNMFGTFL